MQISSGKDWQGKKFLKMKEKKAIESFRNIRKETGREKKPKKDKKKEKEIHQTPFFQLSQVAFLPGSVTNVYLFHMSLMFKMSDFVLKLCDYILRLFD